MKLRAKSADLSLPADAFIFSLEPDGSRPWTPDRVTKRFSSDNSRVRGALCSMDIDTADGQSLLQFIVTAERFGATADYVRTRDSSGSAGRTQVSGIGDKLYLEPGAATSRVLNFLGYASEREYSFTFTFQAGVTQWTVDDVKPVIKRIMEANISV